MHDHHHDHAHDHSALHSHDFLGENHDRNARRTWAVIAITAATMGIEISAGHLYGSMALIADGWHMSTHAAALTITALSYGFARRHAQNPRFAFGTGKVGDLAGFASAVVLAIVALLIAWESFWRLADPSPIQYGQATLVAIIGLLINLLCAFILRDDPHGHDHGPADNNLRAAYLHVLADALTSVLAIAALLLGRAYGWLWLDPAIGLLGALIIARWSWGLIRQAGAVLVDYTPQSEDITPDIRRALERDGDTITDLHVWQLGPGHRAAIINLKSPHSPNECRARLAAIPGLSHVTIEVAP
ncbi:CDF family Co(II)/Ni(II) efflux transporter DmeF [Neogemmobacter tilapiae]|uniref:Cation transporter n=1 Tax=Neogemmobacter tilapiae TaxID=875041 RepID=A0A918TSC2_9RHOB|nr:CDF family Co(II)/Ni(II) efflux transporter DmeF [Gemmobacter tilapiae]GHC60983.1 cation transporter [Gemmobacter tilapiae]